MVKRQDLGFLERMFDLVSPISEERVRKEVIKRLMKQEEPEKIAGYILSRGYQAPAIEWLNELSFWNSRELKVVKLLDPTKAGELALARGNYREAAQIFFETGNKDKCQQATAQGIAILRKEGEYEGIVRFFDCIGEGWQAYETGLKGLEEETFRKYGGLSEKEGLVMSFEKVCSKVNLTEPQRRYAQKLITQARGIIEEERTNERELERLQSEPDDPETAELREYYKCF